jgi:prepilin-type processing-associated H-X9-DG protein
MSAPSSDFESKMTNVLAFVDGHVKFAETKNAALLAADAAIVIALVQLLNGDSQLAGPLRIYLFLVAIAGTLSAIVALLSLLPTMKIPWIRRAKRRDEKGNLLFYGDIQGYDRRSYCEALAAACNYPQTSFSDFELSYAEQIITNGRIASRKFTYFKIAIWMLLVGVLTPIVAGVLLLVVRDHDL